MRAKVKRRQLYRRTTIVAVVVAIILLLVVGFWYAYYQSTYLQRYDNQPVTPNDIATLRQISSTPYGPTSPSMLSSVKTVNGVPFTAGGKPIVVYIGADYCMYCAAQRWSIVLTLMRFGNFSGLEYMSSSPAEGDLPTFTFSSAHYTSKYVVFQGFEQQDRNSQPLQTVPTNYTTLFSKYGSAYPFLNFGDTYVISGALWSPALLAGSNYTSVYSAVKANSTLGSEIKAGANVLTALICKLTDDKPAAVCGQPPITSIILSVVFHEPPQFGGALAAAAPAVLFPKWGGSAGGDSHG